MYLNLSRDLKTTSLRGHANYKWELLMVYHHSDKFGDHRHCDSGVLFLFFCHVTLHDHMFKMLCKFMGGCLSR